MSTKPGALLVWVLLAIAPGPARAAEGALAKALSAALDDPKLAKARVGVHVVELDSGVVVFDRNADVPLNPASGIKLVTSATALDLFGPEHQFETRVLARPHEAGVVKDIWLQGGGDPGLTARDLWRLAHLTAAAGIQRVTGDVVLDHSLFDGAHTPPHFDTKKTDHAYRAPICAAAIEYGTLQIRVARGEAPGAPPRITVDPPGVDVVIDNKATTKAGPSKLVVGTVPLKDQDKVVVRGSVPPDDRLRTVVRRTEFPARVAGEAFLAFLRREGVEVTGGVRYGPAPEGAALVANNLSEPLSVLTARLNKWSNNFIAEMLLKAVGGKAGGLPGTSAKGATAAGAFLTRLGVPAGAFSLSNGSGLYDANRVAPSALTAVLRAMGARADVGTEYLASLAVGGGLGTLRSRLRGDGVAGRVRAKTGTLDRAISLSGYVRSKGGTVYAFAILMEDVPSIGRARRAADALATVLARWGGGPAK